MAPLSEAIRFVAGTKKGALGTVFLQCRVKPGASRVREGITALDDETIELCVSAQAREGEANKAVIKLLSAVLGTHKSDLEITQGLKSRDKTVAVRITNPQDAGEGYATRVKETLAKAAME